MNILLIGSGGREHALAWKISQSVLCSKLFIANGNGGTSECGINSVINISDFTQVKNFVTENKIDFVIVGPEEPLVNGITDFFQNDQSLNKVLILGPSKTGAMLEGSKEFAKSFMERHNIPTATYRSFKKNEIDEAKQFLKTLKAPFVIKADGLAAGKGVVIAATIEEAQDSIDAMFLQNKFGDAGNTIVIEEFLNGIELSFFILTDGKNYKILPEAKDYKRIGENDTGLNTGGMGAVSPVPFADKTFLQKVEEKIVRPSIEGLAKEKISYKGFLFVGLMNVNGDPYVIEYNVRMGDPETEVVIPRIKSDLVDLLYKAASGNLKNAELKVDPLTAATVVLVSGGYPGNYERGVEIIIEEIVSGSKIFHAGTAEINGKLITNGGRVMAVTSFGKDIEEACSKSYRQIDKIKFKNKYYRRDIGKDLEKSRSIIT